jgi:hypothetical protein
MQSSKLRGVGPRGEMMPRMSSLALGGDAGDSH